MASSASSAPQDEAKKAGELHAKLESARERLDKAQAGACPGDPAALREEFNAKQAEETAVAANLAATKKAISADRDWSGSPSARAGYDRPRTDRNQGQAEPRRGEPQAEQRGDRTGEEVAAGRRGRSRSKPPASPSAAGGRTNSTSSPAGTEKKFTDLQAARGGLDPLRAEIDSSRQRPTRSPRTPAATRTG